MKDSKRIKRIEGLKTLSVHAFLICGAISMILPLIWMVITSFKPSVDMMVWPPEFIPKRVVLDHYIKVLNKEYFGRYFLNTAIVTAICVPAMLFGSALSGFVFAKYRFLGKKVIFALIIATIMIPLQVYMIPLYLIMVKLKWVDTYIGIIAPALISSFGIFFMRQNISSIPDMLIDAARIDGYSEFGIFFKIILPLSKSAIGALTIFLSITTWGYFIWPLIIINTQEKFVLELGIATFQQQYYIEYGTTMAASTLALLPVLILFFILRRHIIEGVTLTGLKY